VIAGLPGILGGRSGLTAVALAFAAAACSGGQQPAPSQTPPPDAKRVDPATAGSVAGKVGFDGVVLGGGPLKLDSDPNCAREHPNGMLPDSMVLNNGGLENVFVYVKDGLGGYYFDTPTEPVKLDQKGCRYTPHVLGVRAGQPLEVSNSDATLHNVHGAGTANRQFNYSQPLQHMKNTTTFTAPEVMVHFKCNVHGWMEAYVGVLPHPYFAVTANGGLFELKNLPPGTYTIEAWHEKLGTQTQSVTLGPKEAKSIAFTFKAATS
jgi:plastocyanin